MRLQRAAAVVSAVMAIASTLGAGAPRALPNIALSSVVLFHLERAVALLAGYTFMLVIIVRAWRGELPTEMSSQGIKYATSTSEVPSNAIHVLSIAVDALQARIDRIEDA